MTTPEAELSETGIEFRSLNGAGLASPLSTLAPRVKLGTRLNQLAQIAAAFFGTGFTTIADLAVTTAKLAALAVTTAKIAAGAVTGVKLSIPTSVPLLTAGAEGAGVANAFDVVIALKDQDGVALARAERLKCQAFDINMLPSLVGAITLAEVGAGTPVSAGSKPCIIIDTDVNGAATVRVTDVVGNLSTTIYLLVEVVNKPGSGSIVALVFA